MLKITVVSPQQGKTYYIKDDNYYLKEEIQSEWFGRGAADLGLEGSVETEAFQALLEGKTPDGEQLHAKSINLGKHRAAYDCTFSSPKAFSVAAFRDPRLLEVHQLAVETALSVAEDRYAQCREWNVEEKKQEAVGTGSITAALFPHDTSRSLDPQIHTHVLIFNHTKDSKGNYRALYADEIFANRVLMDKIYLNQLAYGLRELGYEVEQTADAFTMTGFPQEFLDTFSTRRKKEIEPEVARQIANGAVPSGQLYQKAALSTRSRKRDASRESLVAEIDEEATRQGIALPTGNTHSQDLSESGEVQAAIAASQGIDHAEERESVFRRGKVEQFALENHLGQQSWEQLQTALEETNQLVHAEPSTDKYTTQTAIEREAETIRLMEVGRGSVSAIASFEEVSAIASESLTKGQKQALELSATTNDRIIAWQGVAGAGKSYALNLYRQLAEQKGFEVKGFAPSAEGAKVLGEEAQMQADTVASLLHSEVNGMTKKGVWIIDEAGMLSAKDAHALLERATQQQARVILVGDTKQLSAVEAGNPFKSLQAAGLETAKLEESLRQKTEALKLAVDAISRGDLGSSFHHLYQSNSIRGVDSQQACQQQIVIDYLVLSPQQRARTLLIANTNAERVAITQGIREGLQAEGRLADDTFTLTSLKPRDLTIAQAKYVRSYAIGDVIVPVQDYRKQGLTKGEQYEITAINAEQNTFVVQSSDGKSFEVDPSRCDRKTVYEPHQVPIAPGDYLRWTRNERTKARRNGQQFVIEAIDENGQAIARYSDGTTEFIDLRGRQFADYSLVATTYSSQGKTADRVLVALGRSTGKESFYVAASRAKHELTIYTTDEAELRRLAEQSRANENASDYLDLFTYQEQRLRNAQNQISPAETDPGRLARAEGNDSTSPGSSIGGSAGSCLAATLQRDSRTEAGTGNLEQCLAEFNRSSPIAGIEIEPIAYAVAEFAERRELRRNGEEIANALRSIARGWESIAQRDFGSGKTGVDPEPPQLPPQQEQQWQWAEAIFPTALKLAEENNNPYYMGVWSNDLQQFTYTRRKDGQSLFTATRDGENSWAMEQPEGLTAADEEYHQAIDQQRHKRFQQTLTRETERDRDCGLEL